MKIAITGPGALGCYFSAYLFKAGFDVTLVDYRKERAEQLRNYGITVEYEGKSETFLINTALDAPADTDLLFILTKAYVTDTLKIPPKAQIVTLQNGLNNAEILALKAGKARLLAGTTSAGVTRISDGNIRLITHGVCRLGSWDGCNTDSAVEVLSKSGLTVELVDIPELAIWEKAVINAAINPLTALLNVRNGQLLEIEDARKILVQLTEEAYAVAHAECGLIMDNPVERVEEICRLTAGNVSSMLQDIRNHRRTEIDMLSGEIVKRAGRHKIPVNATSFMLDLIHGMEDR